MRSLVNGQINAEISRQDRGLHYGDGLFETMAIVDGEIRHWSLHWQRFIDGCQRLFLPEPNEMQILSEIDHVCSATGKEIVKLIYTRGVTERGYAFDNVEPTRIISAFSWPNRSVNNPTLGVKIKICQTNLAIQPVLAGIKHLNRLENVLARREWRDEYAEGLLCDTNGLIISGTMSNVFYVKGGVLFTPDVSQCGVDGVMRRHIIQVAEEEKISVNVVSVDLQDLQDADEIFLCNSVIGIWPVSQMEDKIFEKDSFSMARRLQYKIN